MVKVETLLASFVAVVCLAIGAPASAQQKIFATYQHTGLIAPNVNGDLFVQCPDGQTAYSGGVDGNFSTDIDVMASAPTFLGSAQILAFSLPDGIRPAPTGWHANVRNRSADPLPVTITTICGPTMETTISVVTSFNVDVGTPLSPAFNGIQVACPGSSIATGGGIDTQTPGTMLISGSGPTSEGKLLAAQPAGSLPAPNGWSTFARSEGQGGQLKGVAICATFGDAITFNSPKLTVTAGATSTLHESCPAGYTLLGGGFDPDNRLFETISAATPFYSAMPTFPSHRPNGMFPGPSGWSIDIRNNAKEPLAANVGLVCINSASLPDSSVYTTAYEFYNTDLKHYFRTAYAEEAAAIDAGAAGPGWVRTGDNFVGYFPQTASPGADVCRFYTHGANSHFYTVEVPECTSLQDPSSGWSFEGLAFRIVKPENGTCPDGTVPVQRLYNNRFAFTDSNHRFTTHVMDIPTMQADGWLLEGVGFCAVAN